VSHRAGHPVDVTLVLRTAADDEQVAFWRRHLWIGVALCVALPLVVVGHTLLFGASQGRAHPIAIYVLVAAVALPAPLLLLVPVERLVQDHRRRHLFFDTWEALGVAVVAAVSLLDGGAHSPYVMFFYVLLAHAALAYPPLGMLLAGAGNIVGYLIAGLVGGDATPGYLFAGGITLACATAVCAYASFNHVLMYRRTAAYAHELSVLAERDGLTGCLNHRTFHERLRAETVIADPTHPLSLLIIDIDHFKTVNDTYGHPAGDEVLRMVGQALHDVVGNGGAPGRLGGDEFAVLLPDTPSGAASAIADQLRDEIRRRTSRYECTVSIGVAESTKRADSAGLLASADRAVYVAKRAGRDRTTGPTGPSPTPIMARRRAG
jgi:diguanylate cyclase (GGDEF)-like protein